MKKNLKLSFYLILIVLGIIILGRVLPKYYSLEIILFLLIIAIGLTNAYTESRVNEKWRNLYEEHFKEHQEEIDQGCEFCRKKIVEDFRKENQSISK